MHTPENCARRIAPDCKSFFHVFLIGLLLMLITQVANSAREPCTRGFSWAKKACHRLHQIWNEGDNELYLSGYAWHNRYTYQPERVKTYNENAWGGGLGKGFYDEDGDWHGLSAIAFLDSHKNLEPAAGYMFLKIARLNDNTRVGAGYSVLVTARPDILHNIPFPGALPWLSFSYRNVTLLGTYIPGAQGAGNVFFLLGKWTFANKS